MSRARISQALKASDLAKLIRQAANRFNLWDVFSDFIEMSALAIANTVDLRQRDEREQRYLRIIGRYEKHEQELFPEMFAALVMGMEESPHDLLGKLFSELELYNADRGQFFTPYELCQLIAQLQIGDKLSEKIAERGFVTMSEPTCGAGAMIIAFADAMAKAGYNYQTQLHVTAQDIDSRAVHMCYLHLSLMHIPAVVILGNTLALEQREVWYTPAHILGGWNWKLRATSRPQAVDPTPEEIQPQPVDLPQPEPDPETQALVATPASTITQMALF